MTAGPGPAHEPVMTRLDRALFAALALLGPAAATPAQTSPEDALRDLLAGNRRFVTGRSEGAESDPGRRRSLARGQGPLAVVGTCADSQAAPERVFDARLGDLVVVRTAGHVLGPDSIVAVERAVDSLRAPLVLVLALILVMVRAHTLCHCCCWCWCWKLLL